MTALEVSLGLGLESDPFSVRLQLFAVDPHVGVYGGLPTDKIADGPVVTISTVEPQAFTFTLATPWHLAPSTLCAHHRGRARAGGRGACVLRALPCSHACVGPQSLGAC